MAAWAGHKCLIPLGGSRWCFLPWLGSYPFLACERFFRLFMAPTLGLKNVQSTRPFVITFRMDHDEQDFWLTLQTLLQQPVDPMKLIYPEEVPLFDKYDEYIPVPLLQKHMAVDVLDVETMRSELLPRCRNELAKCTLQGVNL